MDIKSLFKNLDIGAVGLGWSYLRNGWAGIGEYLVKAFSKMLKKLPADQLKYYAEIVQKVAQLLRMVIDTFIKGEKPKAAATATATAIEELAKHLEDGEYTKTELDQDIDAITACIYLWKEVSK